MASPAADVQSRAISKSHIGMRVVHLCVHLHRARFQRRARVGM
jgi:hypothetical protein